MRAATIARQAQTLGFRSASRSHAGARRLLNEDRVLNCSDRGLWAIADGMGGHDAGDLAAGHVIAALGKVVHGASGFAYLDDLVSVIAEANAMLFAERDGPAGRVSGSTVVAFVAHEGHYACLWAGDSRAYRLRGGSLTPITHDHSFVQELIDAGALQEAARHSHPGAHVVTRAVGAGPAVELDRRFAAIEPDDVFLLCSDGLTNCLGDSEIAALLNDEALEKASDRLLSAALAREPKDNVSFVIIHALADLA